MEHHYRALRMIATLYKVLAVIVVGLSLLAAVAFCALGVISGGAGSQSGTSPLSGGIGGAMGGAIGGIITGVFMVIYGGVMGLGLYGFAELIMVLLSIEESTRGTYETMHATHAAPAVRAASTQPPSVAPQT